MTVKTNSFSYKCDNLTWKTTYSSPEFSGSEDILGGGPVIYGDNYVIYSANVPGWRQLLESGQGVITSMIGAEFKAHYTSGDFVLKYHFDHFRAGRVQLILTVHGPAGMVPTFMYGSPYHEVDKVLVDSIAAERFNSNALAAQQAIQGLVAVGELGETLRMIRHPLQSLFEGCFDYLGAVKKRTRRARKPKEKRKIISDTWLEYSFGWSPLVNDIKSACDAAARLETYSPPRKMVSGQHFDMAVHPEWREMFDLNLAGCPLKLERHVKAVEGYRVRFHGCISVAEVPTHVPDVLGLSVRDIVPTIWELIPYSFLVDYFTNVGSFIDRLSLRSSDFRWGWKGTESTLSVVHTLDSLRGYSSDIVKFDGQSGNCGESTVTQRGVTREAIGGFPWPSFHFKIPGCSTKWLNIAALASASSRTSRIVNGY